MAMTTNGSVIEIHVGYEGELGENGSWFRRSCYLPDDGEDAVNCPGKVGAGYCPKTCRNLRWISPSSLATEFGSGTKAGAKYPSDN